MAANILLTTAFIWILSAIFVIPLSRFWLRRKLQEPAYAHLHAEELTDDDKAQLRRLEAKCFILADVAVLGTAGFIAGLFGYWFLGLSLDVKGWPGMLAFVASSLVASQLAA